MTLLLSNDDVERVSQTLSGGITPIVFENREILAIISKIDLIMYLSHRKQA